MLQIQNQVLPQLPNIYNQAPPFLTEISEKELEGDDTILLDRKGILLPGLSFRRNQGSSYTAEDEYGPQMSPEQWEDKRALF